jgi:hypothetical protein
MITFLFDACALARRYFEDIGTANIDQICRHPDSAIVIPNLAYAETTSAIIASYNAGLLDKDELDDALVLLDLDILALRFTKVKVDDEHIFNAAMLLRRHKVVPTGQVGTGKAGIGGADAVYLAIALALTREARRVGDRLILVTSDGVLYQSALDEPELEAFHSGWISRRNANGHHKSRSSRLRADGGQLSPRLRPRRVTTPSCVS